MEYLVPRTCCATGLMEDGRTVSCERPAVDGVMYHAKPWGRVILSFCAQHQPRGVS